MSERRKCDLGGRTVKAYFQTGLKLYRVRYNPDKRSRAKVKARNTFSVEILEFVVRGLLQDPRRWHEEPHDWPWVGKSGRRVVIMDVRPLSLKMIEPGKPNREAIQIKAPQHEIYDAQATRYLFSDYTTSEAQ